MSELPATDAKRLAPVQPEPLMTAEQVAAYYSVPLQTLYTWRTRGKGPKGYRIGKHLRFKHADVEAFLEAGRDQP